MGLAGAKNKRKLGNDPNNTKWSRNTDSYGQRLLRASGWEPGQYLGAKGAAHAEWHTEASTSHIRVVLKDDNLGLGAKRNTGDECTGLDAFQHLLGRLNGKSEEALESEKKVREDAKLSLYVERKLGSVRFVSGGFLVGDELMKKPGAEGAEEASTPLESSGAEEAATESASKRSKKSRDEAQGVEEEDSKKSSRKEKKSKKRKADTQDDTEEAAQSKSERKKSKKRKADNENQPTESEVVQSSPSEAEISAAEAKRLKKERKEQRKKEKKEKRSKKESSESTAETGDDTEREKKRRKSKKQASSDESSEAPAAVTLGSGLSTPSGSGTSTPTIGSSRYLARSRFIAQKRMAFADSTALNQVSLSVNTLIFDIFFLTYRRSS
ncbi:protein PXR1 [Echria macrotheca]|uniref:PinX1-related protein 1 n=1 Tax=Echria macrotheca TaxID=438768 RepID=A0AAJ0BC90_9PEZI|nr:protein PXR1 [Echria macrotheca]